MRLTSSGTRPKWVFIGAGLVVVIATYLYLILVGASGVGQEGQTATGSTNALIALLGYLIGAGLIIAGVAGQFTTSTYALIPLAIAINIVVGEIVAFLKLPLYLDSIGTVLVAVLVGPWAGAATGGLANIVWGLFRPVPLPFAIVAIAIGLLAGVFARLGWFRRWYLVPIAGTHYRHRGGASFRAIVRVYLRRRHRSRQRRAGGGVSRLWFIDFGGDHKPGVGSRPAR